MIRDLFRTISATGWLLIALAVVLLVGVSYCSYDANRDRRAAEEARSADSRTQARDTAAKEQAADERLADAHSTATMKEELADAVATLPDDVPSDRRLALACRRLRIQNRDAPVVPACRRFEGGAQAGAGA